MITDPTKLTSVLVTDCGSTTTKALLFEKTTDGWRQTSRGEAPTTVEEPVADVTVGALNAFREVQELSGRTCLTDSAEQPFRSPAQGHTGIDLYLSTSSAGGGLQMIVGGVVKDITAESAHRAALGAGAIVLDAISADDRREDHERIARVRHLKPDIVLLTGGVDGGARTHVIELAELLVAASPRPRFGETLRLPVIYAGNRDAAAEVREILQRVADVVVVDNVRPQVDKENLGPAREAIHEFFLSHVMSHAPGYKKLLSWSPKPVMPTPAAVGDMIQHVAQTMNKNVLAVDIGGATTDVFSVFRDRTGNPVFNRTVSANLGMSYSVANVLVESGAQNISRWLPYAIEPHHVRDQLRNKMIRPTSIPQTVTDLLLEQAVCREALRLSLAHHRSLAIGIAQRSASRGIADIFSQQTNRYDLVDLMKLDLVIGSGGVLSHAPDRVSAAMMMIDGFGLCGVTEIAVDSIFMLPHLGVLASVHPQAAQEILIRDCLVFVAHSIAPLFRNASGVLADVFFRGEKLAEIVAHQVARISPPVGVTGTLEVRPRRSDVDVGSGPGEECKREITIHPAGLILDGRNRPIASSGVGEQVKVYNSVGLRTS